MRFVIVLLFLPLGEISAERALDRTGDGLVVGLALSGGGLRSTGVSYGAMLELEERGLLKRIDFISAVSGGSIVGSYYCLGLPLKEFGPKLSKNLLTTSLGKALNPKKPVGCAVGWSCRINEFSFGGTIGHVVSRTNKGQNVSAANGSASFGGSA